MIWLDLESTSPVTFSVRGAAPESTAANKVGGAQEPKLIEKRMAVEMEARAR